MKKLLAATTILGVLSLAGAATINFGIDKGLMVVGVSSTVAAIIILAIIAETNK